MKCFGTEDRVTDEQKKIPATINTIIPYVEFPGTEIKDLIVHQPEAAPPPAAAKPTAAVAPPQPPARKKADPKPRQPKPQAPALTAPAQSATVATTKVTEDSKDAAPAPPTATATRSKSRYGEPGTAGTGAHLLKLRVKKGGEGSQPVASGETFDFTAGLKIFDKDEVLAKVAEEKETAAAKAKYSKDDFFDSISCDLTDRIEGTHSRLTYSEERTLNVDTFGAVSLQNNNYYRNSRNGGRGGRGSGSGRGGGDGRGRSRGRGGGRGYRNHNNNNSQTTAP